MIQCNAPIAVLTGRSACCARRDDARAAPHAHAAGGPPVSREQRIPPQKQRECKRWRINAYLQQIGYQARAVDWVPCTGVQKTGFVAHRSVLVLEACPADKRRGQGAARAQCPCAPRSLHKTSFAVRFGRPRSRAQQGVGLLGLRRNRAAFFAALATLSYELPPPASGHFTSAPDTSRRLSQPWLRWLRPITG